MQMNGQHIRVIGKVTKTQHQNPEFGHTQGDVKVMALLLLKIGLQLCFGLDAVDRINTTKVFCDLGGLLIPIVGGERVFSPPFATLS